MRRHAGRRRVEAHLHLRPVARGEIAGEGAADGLLAVAALAYHIDDDRVLATRGDLRLGAIAAAGRKDVVVLADAGLRDIGAGTGADGSDLPETWLALRNLLGCGAKPERGKDKRSGCRQDDGSLHAILL